MKNIGIISKYNRDCFKLIKLLNYQNNNLNKYIFFYLYKNTNKKIYKIKKLNKKNIINLKIDKFIVVDYNFKNLNLHFICKILLILTNLKKYNFKHIIITIYINKKIKTDKIIYMIKKIKEILNMPNLLITYVYIKVPILNYNKETIYIEFYDIKNKINEIKKNFKLINYNLENNSIELSLNKN